MTENFEEWDETQEEEETPKKHYGKRFYSVGGINPGCGCVVILLVLFLLAFVITAIGYAGV